MSTTLQTLNGIFKELYSERMLVERILVVPSALGSVSWRRSKHGRMHIAFKKPWREVRRELADANFASFMASLPT